jgi:hypothetical protein
MSPSSKLSPAFPPAAAILLAKSSPLQISGKPGMRNKRKSEAAKVAAFGDRLVLGRFLIGVAEKYYAKRKYLSRHKRQR